MSVCSRTATVETTATVWKQQIQKKSKIKWALVRWREREKGERQLNAKWNERAKQNANVMQHIILYLCNNVAIICNDMEATQNGRELTIFSLLLRTHFLSFIFAAAHCRRFVPDVVEMTELKRREKNLYNCAPMKSSHET